MSRALRRGAGFITHRVTRDGRDRWQARWAEPDAAGTPRWRGKVFDTEAEAVAWLETRDTARRRDRPVAAADLTVDALVAEILARSAARLSARTILTYRDRARTMIAPYLGSRRLIDLTPLDVQRWIDRLGREGYRPATIHAAVAVLHTVLRDAAVLGLIERNVSEGVRRPGIAPAPVEAWTAAEARRVLATVREDELYGALYHVALATGMRPGELRALAWADVDLERGRIIVRRTMTRDAEGQAVIAARTKRGHGRAVAIPAPVVAILRWHRARQAARRLACEAWHNLGLVFDRGDGYWLGQNTWRTAHLRLCRAAGVPVIRVHGIRHSYASIQLANGVAPKVVADALGHADIGMTLNIYSHTSDELHRTASELLGTTLFDAAAGDG